MALHSGHFLVRKAHSICIAEMIEGRERKGKKGKGGKEKGERHKYSYFNTYGNSVNFQLIFY